MKIIQTTPSPLITVVGCLHGDETFGARVIAALEPRLGQLPIMQLILANEPAIAAGRRFLDGDLNRSFPVSPQGNREERLAHELLPHLAGSRYVLEFTPLRQTFA